MSDVRKKKEGKRRKKEEEEKKPKEIVIAQMRGYEKNTLMSEAKKKEMESASS